MPAGYFRVSCREPVMVPAPGLLLAGFLLRGRDSHAAVADIEVERRVDFGIVEFHQHIVAGDADLRSPKGDKARNVETADADKIEPGIGSREPQFARFRIGKGRLRFDAGTL